MFLVFHSIESTNELKELKQRQYYYGNMANVNKNVYYKMYDHKPKFYSQKTLEKYHIFKLKKNI